MKGVLEGLLYVEGDLGITLEQVSEILNISLDSAKDLVLSLKEEYIKEDRGLRI